MTWPLSWPETVLAGCVLIVSIAMIVFTIRHRRLRVLIAQQRLQTNLLIRWETEWQVVNTEVMKEIGTLTGVVADPEIPDSQVREEVANGIVRISTLVTRLNPETALVLLGDAEQRDALLRMLMDSRTRAREAAGEGREAPPNRRHGEADFKPKERT